MLLCHRNTQASRSTCASIDPQFCALSDSWRQSLPNTFGSPQFNPQFWSDISANSFLADLSGPLQLHHGSIDKVVPVSFSESLYQQLRVAGQPAELYLYAQGDHNIRVGFDEAMQRTLRFFEARLKAK